MNNLLFAGMGVVTIALIFYTVFIILKSKYKIINAGICSVLSAGAIFDILGTVLMIAGSRKIPLTVHGIIGYTALAGMLIETVLIWRNFIQNKEAETSKSLNIYTRVAYTCWVIAYIAGGLLAMLEMRS